MTAIVPRPNQIGELTRGITLPLASLTDLHLEIVAECLELAWGDLTTRHPGTATNGNEAELNALMVTRLNRLLEEHILWRQLVVCVTRGTETLSYDGSHLEKRPDLSIHLTCRNANFPLLVEGKLIDAKAQKGANLYCEKGLNRFIVGEYAWASREAFMLAYVRDKSTIASTLSPFLFASQATAPSRYSIEKMPTQVGQNPPDLAQSEHGRGFRYLGHGAPNDVPGPISVWHLWVPSGTATLASGSSIAVAGTAADLS